jgi:hypothetical protein
MRIGNPVTNILLLVFVPSKNIFFFESVGKVGMALFNFYF